MYAKRNKTLKALVAVLSVILVMCLTVAGTLAWLVDETAPVVNTFSPSNIDLKLEESPVGENGTATANTYKMIPGIDIAKDPKVTVTADIDSYVFVKVEETENFDTYMTYAIASGWTQLKDADGNDVAGVYYREVSATVDEDSNGDKNVEAFYVLAGDTTNTNGFVTVKSEVTKTQMGLLYNTDGSVNTANQPKLTFTAYAIQKVGFETNVAGAWNEAQGQAS